MLLMGPGGHVIATQDPFVPAAAPTPAPPVLATAAAAAAKPKPKPKRKPEKTVRSELTRLLKAGAITSAQYGTLQRGLGQRPDDPAPPARHARHRARGGHREPPQHRSHRQAHPRSAPGPVPDPRLQPPVVGVGDAFRVPAPTSSSAARSWSGSTTRARESSSRCWPRSARPTGSTRRDRPDYPQMESLLAQMIPLAINRGGGLVWEYYFQFGGGKPPWTSAMSQGTAIEALTRAYLASNDARYLQLAHQALPLFTAPPPIGVRVATTLGRPLRPVHVHPRHVDHQRLPAVADRALRLRPSSATIRWPSSCSMPATPRLRPRCPSSTPAPGRSTSRAWRTPSATTSWSPASSSSSASASRRPSTARPPSTSPPT